MSIKVYVLCSAFITLVNINAINGLWYSFYKYGDDNLDHYLTMDEFNKAALGHPNWQRDAMQIDTLIQLNGVPIPGDPATKGLQQEDFFFFIRERMKGT